MGRQTGGRRLYIHTHTHAYILIHTTDRQTDRQTDETYGKLITVKADNNGVSVCTH